MYGSSPPPPPPPPKDLNRPFQPQQMSSGLLRYRSAPSSLLGEVCEDFLPIRATSPETETETETMFARFLPPENGGGHRNDSQFPPPPPPPPPSTAAVVAETSVGFPSPCDLIYQAQNPVQTLIRQSSSPAGLFNNVENGGYNGVMRRGMMMMSNRNRNRNSSSSSSSSNYSNGEGGGGGGSSSRLKSQLSFSSSRQSSLLLSQISEIHENDSPTTTPIGGGYHHHHPMPYSWEPESNHNHNHNNNNFSSPSSGGHGHGHGPTHNSNLQQNLHGDLGNGLTPHQFSMPKAASTSQGQMAAIHKLLQFQDSVPCKIRAKRGCATHPRSIAERARRTRISERMRKLQELVPNMDKQTNTADMLDLAVDYIKNLQKQVKTLSDSRASCTCSGSKQNPY